MKRFNTLTIVCVLLTGCAGSQHMADNSRPRPKGQEGNLLKQEAFVPHVRNDGGLVIAETEMVGPAEALGKDLSLPDCTGSGYGVSVKTSLADKAYLFDTDGNPCNPSQVLFDGKLKVHQRGTPQGVSMAFLDGRGPLPQNKQEVLDITVPSGFSGTHPEDYTADAKDIQDVVTPLLPVQPVKRDETLEKTVQQWQEESDRMRLMKESEKLLSNVRNINRLSSNELIEAHQAKIEELAARLRESERQGLAQEHRHASLVAQLQHTRDVADAERLDKEQEQGRLRRDVERLSRQAEEIENANHDLKLKYEARENAYKHQMAGMAGDLQDAEQQAELARQEIVLQAAKKIAEAERLAYAARMAKKEAMEREAGRLQLEADMMLNRAADLGQGRSIIIPDVKDLPDLTKPKGARGKGPAKTSQLPAGEIPPLEVVPIVLHEENKPLDEVFKAAFKSMEPKVGTWRITWELSPEHADIAKEVWTVAAESRFDEFLAYVDARVAETWKVQLKFQRFDQNKLFVISE